MRARKFAENVYYHELARKLRGFGYEIRNQARGDFQIEGISDEICERFSKRHIQIDEAIKKLLAEKPECAGGDLMAMRRLLATAERARKQKELSRDEQRALWNAQLSEAERAALRQLPNHSEKITTATESNDVGEAVQWAEDHLFDRNSVVLECQLWQQALERGRGENLSVTELKEFTRQRNYIRNPERPNEVTIARSAAAGNGNRSDRQGRRGKLPATGGTFATRQIQNWMRNSASSGHAASFHQCRFHYFAAVRALEKVSSCASWSSKSGNPARAWSSSRRNASKSW